MDILKMIRLSNFVRVWISDVHSARYICYHRLDNDRFINEKTWEFISTLELYEELYTFYYLDDLLIAMDALDENSELVGAINSGHIYSYR
jgi:hypothetical protein